MITTVQREMQQQGDPEPDAKPLVDHHPGESVT
jgi:hypothetical protein